MKNILVPTDFSAFASFATNAAFEFAADNGSTIHLFSKIDIHKNWFDLTDEEKKQYPESRQRIHNTEVLFKEWKEKAEAKKIPIKVYWSGGKLIESINKYVKANGIDFIIMGSHGTSGKNEYFIGSNTQKVVRTIHCPVLVIKEELSENKPKKVIFASDFNENDKAAFQYLLDFVRPFKPEIHLLEVNTSSWFGQPYILVKAAMKDFKTMCGDLPCYTYFYRDWSVDSGVRNLAEEIGADLISISNAEHRPLRKMMRGSNVEAIVNHANIPVLSIDFPEKIKLESKSS